MTASWRSGIDALALLVGDARGHSHLRDGCDAEAALAAAAIKPN